jgi:hypothetical protein
MSGESVLPAVDPPFANLPHIEPSLFVPPAADRLRAAAPSTHPPRILLLYGSVRPTQGKTLAVMQVSGGSQSFNAVNQMRIPGRWMRMLTIPNQSSVAGDALHNSRRAWRELCRASLGFSGV